MRIRDNGLLLTWRADCTSEASDCCEAKSSYLATTKGVSSDLSRWYNQKESRQPSGVLRSVKARLGATEYIVPLSPKGRGANYLPGLPSPSRRYLGGNWFVYHL